MNFASLEQTQEMFKQVELKRAEQYRAPEELQTSVRRRDRSERLIAVFRNHSFFRNGGRRLPKTGWK